MKVLHIGLIANVPVLLAYGLKKFYNIDVSVATVRSTNLPNKEFIYNLHYKNPFNIEIIERPPLPTKTIEYIKWLSKQDVDIVHCHNGVSFPTGILKYPNGYKVVSHFHGSDLRETSQFIKLVDKVFSDFTLVATPDLLRYIYRKKNVEFIPNPIDPRFFEYKKIEKEYSIFSPIWFNLNKGYDFNLKAWQILRGMDDEVILKVIKEGNDFQRVYSRFSNDKRILWLPKLNREEMITEAQKNIIAWGQQKFGVYGLSELETMALSTPTFSYFDKKYALYGKYLPPLISCSTPKEQAEKTYELLIDDEKRKEIGRKSREWANQFHSIKNVSKILINIYNNIL